MLVVLYGKPCTQMKLFYIKTLPTLHIGSNAFHFTWSTLRKSGVVLVEAWSTLRIGSNACRFTWSTLCMVGYVLNL